MIAKCGRAVVDGAGFRCVCDRRARHHGAHLSHWDDRGERRVWLEWRYEKDGHPMWPGTPGAVDTTTIEDWRPRW